MKIQKTYGIYLFSIALFWAFWLQITANPAKPSQNRWEENWFLSPNETVTLPEFKLIDTRSVMARIKTKIPDAKLLSWEELSRSETPFRGKLQSEDKIQKILSNLGISRKDIVIVLGDGKNGWGEEGRIVWSLREVGYPHAYWYDGSVSSLLETIEKRKQNKKIVNPIINSTNTIKTGVLKKTDISKEEINKQIKLNAYQILDTREPREFAGATPYGESRGGHIPSAKLFYYQNLFDDNGRIKSKEEVDQILNQIGISSTKPIVAYCTGGVRSAFVVGILRSYGYNAYNYSGSMWEWSSYANLPLEK
ncbi:thiosulfate sulfurtransferase [Leptospira yanagawae]|uniref:Thiosulfate sulfurtransferase n=1 Tax=Leptospira yanagawae TaxID=293069 RepID=A0ABY2M448_9LEPT|nr:rhodanese-like domain-containing protein [Leptospira yanagawae]TGL20144.1 thiosulfate sulfurtransferase [Leptospira yanagawae]